MLKLRIIAFSAVLFAIFIPHLSQLNYGPLSLEIIVFTGISIAIGTILGWISRTPITFGVGLGLAVYFFVDVYFTNPFWSQFAFAICVFGVVVGIRFAPVGLPLACSIFALVFAVPSFFAPQAPLLATVQGQGQTAGRDDIAYVHIILDEQASPIATGGQIRSDPGQAEVIGTYLDRDFRLYGLAQSNSSHTYESLSAIFALEDTRDNAELRLDREGYRWRMKRNTLVPALLDAGFDLEVIESQYLRLCGDSARVTCGTYNRAQDMRVVADQGWGVAKRIRLALLQLHDDYLFSGSKTVRMYQGLLLHSAQALGQRPSQTYQDFMRPIAMLRVMDELGASMARITPGQAIIAHILLPHAPYVLGPDCSFRDTSEWGFGLEAGTHVTVERAYETFWDQSVCAHRHLAGILDSMGDRDDVVIVVHGDHGARILTNTDDANDYDNRATLLAVRGPGIEGGLITQPVGLQTTFFDELAMHVLNNR